MRGLPRFFSNSNWALFIIGAATAGCSSSSTNPTPDKSKTSTDSIRISAQLVFTTEIRKTEPPRKIPSGKFDEQGQSIDLSCVECHSAKPPNGNSRLGLALTLFHQKIDGKHGNLSCMSCHQPDDGYKSLRLADGKSIPFSDVMNLCAQCHGPQYRDYQHGAHGGMTGYWDLSKGPRERNNCIDCHSPHAPKFPLVQPALGPNDRFLSGGPKHE